MKSISTLAIAVSLVAGGALLATPALAQKKNEAAAAQPAEWAPKLAKEEAAALDAVQVAANAKDWAAAAAALPAAQAAATTPDGRYFVGRFQLQIGAATNNQQLQAQGIEAMIASGGGDPTKLALLHKSLGGIAVQMKDLAKAEAAFARWSQLAPNDIDAQMAVAEIKYQQKKPQEALPLIERAIAARQAAGTAVPESWHLLALQAALDARMEPQTLALSKALIAGYPNAKNWRNGILIYRQANELDPAARIDALRLMRATKSLDRPDEYLLLADALSRGKFYGEAKAVIDEGKAAGKVPAGDPTAAQVLSDTASRIAPDRAALPDLEGRARSAANGELALRVAEGYYGHGDHAKAAEFYRLALEKGAVDANLVNTRLGIALALAGRKPEAETAFKAVTGARAGLAGYWLLWLNQRG